jgi:hypothetical protein
MTFVSRLTNTAATTKVHAFHKTYTHSMIVYTCSHLLRCDVHTRLYVCEMYLSHTSVSV